MSDEDLDRLIEVLGVLKFRYYTRRPFDDEDRRRALCAATDEALSERPKGASEVRNIAHTFFLLFVAHMCDTFLRA